MQKSGRGGLIRLLKLAPQESMQSPCWRTRLIRRKNYGLIPVDDKLRPFNVDVLSAWLNNWSADPSLMYVEASLQPVPATTVRLLCLVCTYKCFANAGCTIFEGREDIHCH